MPGPGGRTRNYYEKLDIAIRVEIVRLPGPSLPPDHMRGLNLDDAIDFVTNRCRFTRGTVVTYHEDHRQVALIHIKEFGARLAHQGRPR
jgi:hypothetical protein